MQCSRCGGDGWKAGLARGKQRYKCKACGYHYTQAQSRHYNQETRQKAIALYLEGLGFRAIGRLLGVSNVTVLKWVRQAALQLPEPEKPTFVDIIELDELWHFVKKRRKNAGFGLVLTVYETEHLPSSSAAVVFSP